MLTRPRKTKYNKCQRDRLSFTLSSFRPASYGKFALLALEPTYIGAKQIEATRQVINRYLKRKGKIWIRVFPDFPLTCKPAETRMGKGKAAVKEWVCRVQKGTVLFEVDGVADQRIAEALQAAKKKLPLKTFIYKSSWKEPLSL